MYIYIYIDGAVSSVVERLPYKQRVTGSSPVPPSLNLGSSSKGLGQKPSKFPM